MWPTIAAMPATAGRVGARRPAARRAARSPRPSPRRAAATITPACTPDARSTLAAPRLPLPTRRRSAPRRRASSSANGTDRSDTPTATIAIGRHVSHASSSARASAVCVAPVRRQPALDTASHASTRRLRRPLPAAAASSAAAVAQARLAPAASVRCGWNGAPRARAERLEALRHLALRANGLTDRRPSTPSQSTRGAPRGGNTPDAAEDRRRRRGAIDGRCVDRARQAPVRASRRPRRGTASVRCSCSGADPRDRRPRPPADAVARPPLLGRQRAARASSLRLDRPTNSRTIALRSPGRTAASAASGEAC